MTDGLPQWIRDLAVQVHSMIERHNLFARFQDELRVWSSKLPSDVAFEDGLKPIDLLPFPKRDLMLPDEQYDEERELTLPEQCAILAAIHDEGRTGKKINPWPNPIPKETQSRARQLQEDEALQLLIDALGDDGFDVLKEGIPYAALRSKVMDVPQSDLPYIEEVLAAVERDLTGTLKPAKQSTEKGSQSEHSHDSVTLASDKSSEYTSAISLWPLEFSTYKQFKSWFDKVNAGNTVIRSYHKGQHLYLHAAEWHKYWDAEEKKRFETVDAKYEHMANKAAEEEKRKKHK